MLRLPGELLNQMIAHALAMAPEEACGILTGFRSGPQRVVLRAIACRNVHEGCRIRRFLIDPEQQLAAQREARRQGLEIVGYYHSHLNGSAAMSEDDVRQAHPWVSNLILAFRGGAFLEARSWRVDPRGVCEEEPLDVSAVTNGPSPASLMPDGC